MLKTTSLRFLELRSIRKLNYQVLNNCLTNFVVGVMTDLMLLSNVKIINKLSNFKTIFIKAGIIASLTVYWGVIIVGTFITFI